VTTRLSVLLAFAGFGGAVAAPVPPSPPIPDRPAPTLWNLANLNALFPDPDDSGPVTVLVWKVIDYEGFEPRLEVCLAVKKYAKPKEGVAYALGYFQRLQREKPSGWVATAVSRRKDGATDGTLEHFEGVKSYKGRPSDQEIATFLKELIWGSELRYTRGSRVEAGKPRLDYEVQPKVIDGGICRVEWKKLFDREPPAKLFPELTKPSDKK
jgi:hypothetical protein